MVVRPRTWVIDTEPDDANNIFLPVGFVDNDYATALEEPESAFTFEIGRQWNHSEAYDDEWIFNTADHITNGSDAAVLGGGSYENGSGAGVWFMELIDVSNDSRADVGFRCIYRLFEENYFENQMGEGELNH